ncbi:MAG: hypothetical protein ACRCZF_22390 [Gemmataceae bacterium]
MRLFVTALFLGLIVTASPLQAFDIDATCHGRVYAQKKEHEARVIVNIAKISTPGEINITTELFEVTQNDQGEEVLWLVDTTQTKTANFQDTTYTFQDTVTIPKANAATSGKQFCFRVIATINNMRVVETTPTITMP